MATLLGTAGTSEVPSPFAPLAGQRGSGSAFVAALGAKGRGERWRLFQQGSALRVDERCGGRGGGAGLPHRPPSSLSFFRG